MFAALAASAQLGPEKGFSASEMGIERLDPAFDALIPADAKVEKLAEGFIWSEGPTWFPKLGRFLRRARQRHLSVEARRYRCKCVHEAERLAQPSARTPPTELKRSRRGYGRSLLICQQGERRVARLEKNGTQTLIAAKFDGKRFNSPNDLAIRKNGDVYFTDPPYGLANFNDSPLKELPITASIAWIRKAG